MPAQRSPKPHPLVRLLFFVVGLYFLYESYLGITEAGLTDSVGGFFRYLALYPGLGLFFCWRMALRGSAWWNDLPRWMKK